MRRLGIVLSLWLVLGVGCASKNQHISHPNAINQVDSSAYDTLLTAQAALEEAKAHISEHPEAKQVLNQAIASYNSAQAAYKIYHGLGDPQSGADLATSLSQLLASVSEVEKVFGRQP